MSSPEEAKKMLEDLEKKANDLADSQLKGIPKLIDQFMLTDRQIAKKIISFKSPKLTDSELNLIVFGKDLKKELGASYKPFVSDNDKLNPNILSKDLKSYFKPLDKDSPVFDEVKDGVYLLEQRSKDLGKEVIKFGVLIGSTIPAAVILTAPPSFNVPGSMTLTVNLLNGLSQLKTKMKDFVPTLRIVDKLKFVLPDEKVEQITKPINSLVEVVDGLYKTVGKLQLPGMDEVKEKLVTDKLKDAQNQMDGLDDKLNSLDVSQFSNFTDPQAALESEKNRLTDLKKTLAGNVKSLLKS